MRKMTGTRALHMVYTFGSVTLAVTFALVIGLVVGGVFSDILTIIHRLATN